MKTIAGRQPDHAFESGRAEEPSAAQRDRWMPRQVHWLKIAKLLWASPCSAVGLALAAALLLARGRAKWSSGALEVTYREGKASCGTLARMLPFRGMVFGHVILAVTREELRSIGPHERVHVEQYERWGPLFLFAYGASSLWQLLHARNPYWYNHFEVQARALAKGLPSMHGA